MKVAPRPLIILHPEADFQIRVRTVADGRFEIRTVGDWERLQAEVQSAPPAAVVLVDPYFSRQGRRVKPAKALQSLLERFPSATVIAASDFSDGRYRDILTLGSWGVAEVVHMDEEMAPEALSRRLNIARAQPLREILEGDMAFVLSDRGRAIMDAAIDVVSAGGHPRDLAAALDLSTSTLLRWCTRSRLPTPRRLLVWMRLLLASALLDSPGHNVLSVATACGYSSDQALRRALRTVTPLTPSELRDEGALKTISRGFVEELAELRQSKASSAG
jgi:AraC-like DNA-binding protein